MRPILALTMGDINGVGPEILAKALARPDVGRWCRPLVVGSASVLAEAARGVPACPTLTSIAALDEFDAAEGVPVLDAGLVAPTYRPGTLDPEAGRCAVEWLIHAVGLAQEGAVAGIVTCPLNKEGIHRAGYSWQGHTDLIAALTGVEHYAMSLFADDMRAVHVSAHLSLRDAIAALSTERILATIRLAHEALVRLKLPQQRVAVAGLNPHAGEAGAFGREEIDIVAPAVAAARTEGIACSGPHPADTIFRRMAAGEWEVVVALYHDQGHIPLKLIAMERGVNVTLGIPIIRTSVDHGTAYDIAGTGQASEESLCCAIKLAAQLAGNG
jgi:4-hydroxythreonine-4-phosphate dehydrogenase